MECVVNNESANTLVNKRDSPPTESLDHSYSLKTNNLEAALLSELIDFNDNEKTYSGYLSGGVSECNEFLKKLRYLGYPFAIRNSSKKKVSGSPRLMFAFWKDSIRINFFGHPFCIMAYYQMDCLKGPGRQIKILNNMGDKNVTTKASNKKIGCPAKLIMKVVRYFPQYSILSNKNGQQKEMLIKKLRNDFTNPKCTIAYRERVYLSVSKENGHTHTPIPMNVKKKRRRIKNTSCESKNDPTDGVSGESEICDTPEFEENHSDILESRRRQLLDVAQGIVSLSSDIEDCDILQTAIDDMKKLSEYLNSFDSGNRVQPSPDSNTDEQYENKSIDNSVTVLKPNNQNSRKHEDNTIYYRIEETSKVNNAEKIMKAPIILHICQDQGDTIDTDNCIRYYGSNEINQQFTTCQVDDPVIESCESNFVLDKSVLLENCNTGNVSSQNELYRCVVLNEPLLVANSSNLAS